jgi:hypothetical protein
VRVAAAAAGPRVVKRTKNVIVEMLASTSETA